MKKPARTIESLLEQADIRINGSRPQDVRVHDDRLWRRVLTGGSLALGEAYLEGWWEANALDAYFTHLLTANPHRATAAIPVMLHKLRAALINLQSKARAFQVGRVHYDLGNDLYETMLDRRMVYSCAYWPAPDATLDQAQEAKLRLVCEKLGLEPGMRVLDIGCGWGGAARFAAETFGVDVTGITISKQQADYATEACKGLPVEIRLQDYRDTEGQFDRIFSIGMFEHVGKRNYRTYMQTLRRLLKPDGIALLHTIGGNRSTCIIDPWIGTYIFPNAMLPSPAQISRAAEALLVIEDWHNIGPHYDPTLMAWHRNVTAGWDRLRERYDDRFYRMWTYYLQSCAALFRVRRNQVWQLVRSPSGIKGGYRPLRCPAGLNEVA